MCNGLIIVDIVLIKTSKNSFVEAWTKKYFKQGCGSSSRSGCCARIWARIWKKKMGSETSLNTKLEIYIKSNFSFNLYRLKFCCRVGTGKVVCPVWIQNRIRVNNPTRIHNPGFKAFVCDNIERFDIKSDIARKIQYCCAFWIYRDSWTHSG